MQNDICAESEIWGCHGTSDGAWYRAIWSKFTDFLEGPAASLLCTCKADVASFSFASMKSK